MIPSSIQINKYKKYIYRHADMVEKYFSEKLIPSLSRYEPMYLDNQSMDVLLHRIPIHDQDKITDRMILYPYACYHDTCDPNIKSSEEYRHAWLMHQKLNPHHWQYWVVLNDETDPKIDPLPMDHASIVEMICDWCAASQYYGSTVHEWYHNQSENMILHDRSREDIIRLIGYVEGE